MHRKPAQAQHHTAILRSQMPVMARQAADIAHDIAQPKIMKPYAEKIGATPKTTKANISTSAI